MKFISTNIFLKGCIADLDENIVPTEYWTFPSLNLRVMTKDGQGYIISTMKGNTLYANGGVSGDQGEQFSLEEGYVPVGCCEFNGVLYILSYNETTDTGELGTFPSCDWLAGSTTFERVYRQTYNYDPVGAGRDVFRTILFNFDLSRRVEMFPRKDYDGSVNLYCCDYHNRNRVINSGFDQTGALTTRIYSPEDFQTFINQYPITRQTAMMTMKSITSLGYLLCGNYFFYARYLTHDYNPTDIIAETGPCATYRGASYDNTYTSGTIASVDGGSKDDDSGKKITLHFENLDTSYRYIKLYFTRCFSGTTDVIEHENKEIIFEYPITGNSMDIEVYGNESMMAVDDSALLEEYPEDIICKSHDHAEDIYFGANWKSRQKHHQDLIDFAQLVYPCVETDPIDLPPLNEVHSGIKNYEYPTNKNGYRDYYNIYNKVGYFRGETYAFALIYEFRDGTMSKAYPILGIDAYDMTKTGIYTTWTNYFGNTPSSYINKEGIVRFPRNGADGVWNFYNSWSQQGQVMFPVMTFTEASDWVNDTSPTWFIANVRTVHVVRAERNKNLLYQGYSFATAKPTGTESNAEYTAMQGSVGNLVPCLTGSIINAFPPKASDDDYSGVVGGWGIGYNDYKYVGPGYWRQYLWSGGQGYKHEYKNDVHFPFWKGFAPGHFYKKSTKSAGGDDGKQKAIVNICTITRLYLDPGYLAFYSFDFLLNRINETDNVKFYEVQARIMPDGLPAHADYYNSQYEYQNPNLGTRQDPMLAPRVYLVDLVGGASGTAGYWDYNFNDRRGNVNEVTKIGEERWVSPVNLIESTGNFINKTSEYYQNPADCMWAIIDTGGVDRDNLTYSRSCLAAKYIGWYNKASDLEHTSVWHVNNYYNVDHCVVNFYKKNPLDFTSDDLLQMYNIEDEIYYIISDPIDILQLPINKPVYRGDCFVQRAYFKQRYWDGSQFGSSGDHEFYDLVGLNEFAVDNPDNNPDLGHPAPPPIPAGSVGFYAYFTHGMLMGLVLESENNIAMRHAGDTTNYFPHNTDAFNFARLPYNTVGIESLSLNKGYNCTLSVRGFFHYDKYLPAYLVTRENRVRHSAKHTDGSFVDGYRDIEISSFHDFETKNGPINKLINNNNTLFAIQRDGIIQLFTNEKEVKTPTSVGDTIIGTGPILAEQYKPVADFGTQHQWSVVSGNNGIYGVDWKRRVVWGIRSSVSELTGSRTSGGMDLGAHKLVHKWIYELFESYDTMTDIVSELDDTPLLGEGIVSGYDPKYGDVFFSFLYSDKTLDYSRTLVFNENVDAFTCEASFKPVMYANIHNDFYSVYHEPLGGASKYFHLHDQEPYLTFYNELYEWKLSIFVNGKNEEQNTSSIVKIYDSHKVDSSDNEFAYVEYTTEYQYSLQTPFLDTTRFWLTPKYKEHHWIFPVFMKTDADNGAFYTDSNMRGKWMKTTLTYQDTDPTYVKSIETVFELSKS